MGTSSTISEVRLIQPKHILRASSLGEDNLSFWSDDFKPCQFEREGTEGFKQVYALAW